MRGAIAIGGLRRDLPTDELGGLREQLADWRAEARRFESLVLGSEGFLNRMRRTGVLGNISSVARHRGLAWSAAATSSSVRAKRRSSQAMCA